MTSKIHLSSLFPSSFIFKLISFFALSLFLVIGIHGQAPTPQVSSTLNDTLALDRDGDGQLDAGDTLRYTLEIVNCSSTTAENVQFSVERDLNTQFLQGSIHIGAFETAPECGGQTNPPSPPDNTQVPQATATLVSATDIPSTATSIPTLAPTTVPVIPSVSSVSPIHGSSVALSSDIAITFNTNVNVTGDWFQMVCAVSGSFTPSGANIAVAGGPITFNLNPNINLQAGETCTVTILASQVTDNTPDDPPSNMTADYVFSFSADAPPQIASTSPTNGATNIPIESDIVFTFSEPVNVNAASFTLECPAATPFAGGFAVSGSGTNLITLNPTGNLPAGITCQVSIIAFNISDVDSNDPPDLFDGNGDNIEGDNYSFTFTTMPDQAPAIQGISPANGATDVPRNTTISLTFIEPVNITSASNFELMCSGMPQGYIVTTPSALPASTTIVVITPGDHFPENATCTFTVYGSQISDTDLDDPPDTMSANFVSTFTTGSTIVNVPETEISTLLANIFDLGGSALQAQSGPLPLLFDPISIGSIPPNSKVTITFDVEIHAVIPQGTTAVSVQGIVSGSNFATIRTDDPQTGQGGDATITPLSSLQAVGALPQTGESIGWRDPLIWGMRFVLLGGASIGVIGLRRKFWRH